MKVIVRQKNVLQCFYWSKMITVQIYDDIIDKYSESERTFFLTSLASDGDSGALTGVPLAESISRLKLDCMDSCEPLAMDGIRDRPPTDAPETDESRRGPISPFCWELSSKNVQILGDMTFYITIRDQGISQAREYTRPTGNTSITLVSCIRRTLTNLLSG